MHHENGMENEQKIDSEALFAPLRLRGDANPHKITTLREICKNPPQVVGTYRTLFTDAIARFDRIIYA